MAELRVSGMLSTTSLETLNYMNNEENCLLGSGDFTRLLGPGQ